MLEFIIVIAQTIPALDYTSAATVMAWIIGVETAGTFAMAGWIVKFLTGHIQKNNDTMKDLIHAIENLKTVVDRK